MRLTRTQFETLWHAKHAVKALAGLLEAKGPLSPVRYRGVTRARCLWLLNELGKLEKELRPDNPEIEPDETRDIKGLNSGDDAEIRARAAAIRRGLEID